MSVGPRDHGIHDLDWLTTFNTIMNYVVSDIKKKQQAFKIGVFCIFITVGFISMLKSATDVAPIAFLKVA